MFRIQGAIALLVAGVVVGWACDSANAEVKVQHAVLQQKPGQPLRVQPVQYGWGMGVYSTPYYYSYYGPYSYPYMTYYNYGPYYSSSMYGVNPYAWPATGYGSRWAGFGGTSYYGPGGGAILGNGGVGYYGGYGGGYGYGMGGAGCNCY
ncbi:MAG TPA: hypothetical protein VHB77_07840 [Planctomycetaceae bacterium]|jgi:hypothetical protein|nr:hypothetical protein [Planctomycetaceae bacterium]